MLDLTTTYLGLSLKNPQLGTSHVTTILQDLHQWMEEHEYSAITQMKGSMSQRAVAEPAVFERANYMKALNSFDASIP
jgi:dihydroorotate dehydrogenase (fumarate)